MGHPVLARPAREVADPGAPAVRRLVRDMLDTMADANGTGLAAPQVYVPLRLVMFFVARERAEAEDGSETEGDDPSGHDGEVAGADQTFQVPLTILFNPVIDPLDEAKTNGMEACLSVPGLAGQVPRYNRIRYRGLTLEGEPLEREAEGFHARVVQHECDHLDGILYPQRMTDLSTLVFTSEIGKSFPDEDGLRS